MPKIDADSVQEHVRQQTDRILSAAGLLFRERGYRGTDLGDIADAVGLARNSLYRYYPNKDQILLACVRRDMVPFVAEIELLEGKFADPMQRIGAWLDAEIDIAVSPAHATMEMMAQIRQEEPELRREIMRLHELPNAVLERAVAQLIKGRRRDIGLLTALIGGMVEAAARQALTRGNAAAIKRELRRAVAGVLGQ